MSWSTCDRWLLYAHLSLGRKLTRLELSGILGYASRLLHLSLPLGMPQPFVTASCEGRFYKSRERKQRLDIVRLAPPLGAAGVRSKRPSSASIRNCRRMNSALWGDREITVARQQGRHHLKHLDIRGIHVLFIQDNIPGALSMQKCRHHLLIPCPHHPYPYRFHPPQDPRIP